MERSNSIAGWRRNAVDKVRTLASATQQCTITILSGFWTLLINYSSSISRPLSDAHRTTRCTDSSLTNQLPGRLAAGTMEYEPSEITTVPTVANYSVR